MNQGTWVSSGLIVKQKPNTLQLKKKKKRTNKQTKQNQFMTFETSTTKEPCIFLGSTEGYKWRM